MVSFSAQSYSKRLLPLISWGHWFTFFNIGAAVLLSAFYLVSEPLPETFIGQSYLFANLVSHIAFLVFMCFVLILFPIILVFPNTRFIRTVASVIFTVVLLLLLLDAYVYNQLGYHLNVSSTEQVTTLISGLIAEHSRFFWSISLFLCLIILSFQFTVSNYAWKHLRQLQKTKFAKRISFGLVIAFFYSHITHIWADVDLDYDVLRQDTLLPLSYPTTAKALLTKYGMFNSEDYIARKTAPLSLTDGVPNYPELTIQCQAKPKPQSVFVVLTNNMLSKDQLNQIEQRANGEAIKFLHHVDNANADDAWFNLLYGLPTIYKQGVLAQEIEPVLFQGLSQLALTKTLTIIDEADQHDSENNWYTPLFDYTSHLKDISSLVFADKLNTIESGIHFIYFTDGNAYQFQLFMDALLLAQKQKGLNDIVWVSTLGNEDGKTRFLSKPSILLTPDGKSRNFDFLTSQMDIAPTLVEQWLGCDIDSKRHSIGSNIIKLTKDRIIANSLQDGIMVYSKDRSIFIDQNGNFTSYSQQLETPIVVNEDFPLMIDGVHYIRQFATNNRVKEAELNDLSNKATNKN